MPMTVGSDLDTGFIKVADLAGREHRSVTFAERGKPATRAAQVSRDDVRGGTQAESREDRQRDRVQILKAVIEGDHDRSFGQRYGRACDCREELVNG